MGRLFLFGYRENVACCHDKKQDRVKFAHIRSPPFGGKTPPRDFSRPGRFVCIIHGIMKKYKRIFCNIGRMKPHPIISMRGCGFCCMSCYSSIVTCIPTFTYSLSARRSSLFIRMQPSDARVPMLAGSCVPWMPMPSHAPPESVEVSRLIK